MGNPESSGAAPTHEPGTRKGEEIREDEGQEAGRQDTGETHANRPSGTKTARDSTGINPEDVEPADPDMPNMPPA